MSIPGHVYKPIVDSHGNLIPGCVVRVYAAGTTTLVSAPFYSNAALAAPVSNPFTCASGVIDLYFNGPTQVALGITLPVQGATEQVFDYIESEGNTYYQSVVDGSGTVESQEPKIKFVGSGAAVVSVADDAAGQETVVTVNVPVETDYYQSVEDSTNTIANQRSKTQFTGSGTATVTVTDDSANDRTVVNVSVPNVPVETDYYQSVVDPSNVTESQRGKIKFANSGGTTVTVTDDPANGQTVVSVGSPVVYYNTITNASGSPQTQRSKVQFVGADNVTLTITDDATNDQTIVNVDVLIPGLSSAHPLAGLYFQSASHVWELTVDDTGHLTTTLIS